MNEVKRPKLTRDILIGREYLEDRYLGKTKYVITHKNIKVDFNKFKIIQLSDVHNTGNKRLRQQLIKEVEFEKPDIIAITGDFIDCNRFNIDIATELIEKLTAIATVYFSTGNHEAKNELHYEMLKNILIKRNVHILENSVEEIKIGDSSINIFGIHDTGMYHTDKAGALKIIESDIDKLEYNPNNFSVLLSHRPEIFNWYVKHNFNLVLTGHTHGGQIRIPKIGGLYTPDQGLFPVFTSGVFRRCDTLMIISRGIGNSKFPIRINNKPELGIIELRQGDDEIN